MLITSFVQVSLVATMTLIWTSYTLMIKWTKRSGQTTYHSTTVVLCSEVSELSRDNSKCCYFQIAKCTVTLLALWREQHYSLSRWRQQLATDYFGRPKELLKMSVPSLAYAIQNNLDFVALANLDPGVYQVGERSNEISSINNSSGHHTAESRQYCYFHGDHSAKTSLQDAVVLNCRALCRFVSLPLSFDMNIELGVALVQLDQTSATGDNKAQENYALGLTAVLITCCTAGFAGAQWRRHFTIHDYIQVSTSKRCSRTAATHRSGYAIYKCTAAAW